jgi:hypothetical protein
MNQMDENTMTELKKTIDKIDSHVEKNESLDTQVDSGSEFGSALASHLTKNGWKPYQNLSVCSKASFQAYLEYRGHKIEIISASFMGVFTDIRVFLRG